MPEPLNQTQTFRFDEMALQVKDKIDNPAEAVVDRYVGLEHIDPESLKIRRWGKTTDVESSKLAFKSGDIIFGKRRAYQRKLAVADFDGICSAHAMVLRPKTDIVLEEFLPFFMQSNVFMERAVKISVGGLSPTINWKALGKEEFALPPLEEQRRISEVLQATARLRESLQHSMQSAETLLRSAVDAAAEKAIERKSVVLLEELVDRDRPICYGILMPGTGFEGGVPVVKVKDYPEGEIIEDGLLLTDPAIDKEYERSRLRTGDLLISIRGTIGRLAFVTKSLDGANITQDTARLSLRPEHDSRYVRAILESTFVQRQIAAFTTGLAVKGINIGELRRIQIPVVLVEEQREVVHEVVEVRAAIRNLEERMDQADSLLKSASAKFFRGAK